MSFSLLFGEEDFFMDFFSCCFGGFNKKKKKIFWRKKKAFGCICNFLQLILLFKKENIVV